MFKEFEAVIHALYLYSGDSNIHLYHSKQRSKSVVNILHSDKNIYDIDTTGGNGTGQSYPTSATSSSPIFEIDGITSQPGRPPINKLLYDIVLQSQAPITITHATSSMSTGSTSGAGGDGTRNVGVMVCGPESMVEEVKSVLVGDKVLSEHTAVYTEEFNF